MKFNWRDEYYRYQHYVVNLKKQAQTTKAKSFAWISLTIFTISFFVLVAIQPTLVTIAKLNKEIKDKEEASQKLQAKINSLIAAQAEFAKKIDYLSLLEEALPEKNDFPRLAYFFEQAATNEGISLQSLSFTRVGAKEVKSSLATPQQMTFSVGVTGEYSQLENFLRRLESSRRLFRFERIAFIQTKTKEGQVLSFAVSGQAYFLKQQP